MFASNDWKNQIAKSIQQLELQIQDLKRNEMELKAQNSRLSITLKNFARKMVMRLPISLESLEKGLMYDLIFSDEIEAWKQATRGGLVLDIRVAHEHNKNNIPGSMNIPYDQLSARIETLPRDQAVLLVCDNGVKSVTASEQLTMKGFHFLYVLKGGMSMYQGTELELQEISSHEQDDRAIEATA